MRCLVQSIQSGSREPGLRVGRVTSEVDRAVRSGPLEGTVVADFSRVLAGPLATATLADLGATVVKVERPGRRVEDDLDAGEGRRGMKQRRGELGSPQRHHLTRGGLERGARASSLISVLGPGPAT